VTALSSPAAARNREPILAVLRQHLPQPGEVLEVASGGGEHAAWFAAAMPQVTWRPSDRDDASLASIAAWREQAGAANLLEPVRLDAAAEAWPVERADAVVCINMIHIAPWAAAEGLMRGAGRVLPPGGVLYLYGPFRVGGEHTAPSNAAFDESLRARDPAWGVRDLEEVTALAQTSGLAMRTCVPMPANNLSVVFERR
jgi:SAM-dependent methyltransferase